MINVGNFSKTVGVVHGGQTGEREKSVKYGQQVTKILKELGMNVLEIHLHPNGSWTVNGQVKNVEESLKKVDSVWNCLVGKDGESGVVEKICEKCNTKLVGHGTLHTHLAAHKKNLHLTLDQHKIKTPYGKVITKEEYSKDKLLAAFASVGIPAVVKPSCGSGVWGISVVNNFTEMENAVEGLISKGEDVLVEKVVVGVPVSCFVLEHNNLYQTSINVEDGQEKLSREDLLEIRNTALYIHNVLAFGHHTEYDFIIGNKNGKRVLYFLEANTHPSLAHGYIKQVFNTGVVNFKNYIASKFA